MHWNRTANAWLGSSVDGEPDADLPPGVGSNIDPLTNIANRDDLPGTTGIVASTLLLPSCGVTNFQYNATVVGARQRRYTNAWIDFNGDGDWEDSFRCRVGTTTYTAREWVVRNQATSYGPGAYLVTTPNFNSVIVATAPALKWMRLTLSNGPAVTVTVPSGADGRGPLTGYAIGETEDYLLRTNTVFALSTDDSVQDGTIDFTVAEPVDTPADGTVVVEEVFEIPLLEDPVATEPEEQSHQLYLPLIQKQQR